MPQRADVLDLAVARLAGRPMTDGAVFGLGRAALRTSAPGLLDVLALRATEGAMLAADVAHALRATGRWPDAALRQTPAALSLACQWAVGGEQIRDQPLARLAFEDVLARAGRAAFVDAEWSAQLAVQLPWFAGDLDAVERLMGRLPLSKDQIGDLRIDLANPYATHRPVSAESRAGWLRLFNERFRMAGLAEVTVDPGAEHPFDGLRAGTGPSVDGPLVSVIVPCYAPDEGLLNSIASMAAQSYGNMEILIVDDASGPAYAGIFEAAAALDPRARVITMPVNGGSYLGRNEALNSARGRYLTTQDSDDWSHPERIADQVRLLEDNPLAPASRSDAIRALDDLSLQWLGSESVRRNASSLMVRRSTVEAVGVFDTVRKGADSEFHERIERRLGPTVDTSTPLAITRLRGGSLSRSDFRLQWMSPDRVLYRAGFRASHQVLRAGRPMAAARQLARRSFPAPRSFQRALPGAAALPTHYDVVYLVDLTVPSALTDNTHRVALPEGLRAAMVFQEDPTSGRPRRPNPLPRPMALAMAGRIDLISASDAVTCDHLVVLTPGLLEMPSSDEPRLRPGQVSVVLTAGSLTSPVDHLAVLDGGRSLFGAEVEFVALNEADARAWALDSGEQVRTLAQLLASGSSPALAEATHPAAGSGPTGPPQGAGPATPPAAQPGPGPVAADGSPAVALAGSGPSTIGPDPRADEAGGPLPVTLTAGEPSTIGADPRADESGGPPPVVLLLADGVEALRYLAGLWTERNPDPGARRLVVVHSGQPLANVPPTADQVALGSRGWFEGDRLATPARRLVDSLVQHDAVRDRLRTAVEVVVPDELVAQARRHVADAALMIPSGSSTGTGAGGRPPAASDATRPSTPLAAERPAGGSAVVRPWSEVTAELRAAQLAALLRAAPRGPARRPATTVLIEEALEFPSPPAGLLDAVGDGLASLQAVGAYAEIASLESVLARLDQRVRDRYGVDAILRSSAISLGDTARAGDGVAAAACFAAAEDWRRAGRLGEAVRLVTLGLRLIFNGELHTDGERSVLVDSPREQLAPWRDSAIAAGLRATASRMAAAPARAGGPVADPAVTDADEGEPAQTERGAASGTQPDRAAEPARAGGTVADPAGTDADEGEPSPAEEVAAYSTGPARASGEPDDGAAPLTGPGTAPTGPAPGSGGSGRNVLVLAGAYGAFYQPVLDLLRDAVETPRLVTPARLGATFTRHNATEGIVGAWLRQADPERFGTHAVDEAVAEAIARLAAELDGADVVFADWCDPGAAFASWLLPPSARLVIRVHRVDAVRVWHQMVNWPRVAEVIFVSDHVKEMFARQVTVPGGDPPVAMTVLRNVIDVGRYRRPKTPGAHRRIALVGWSRPVKDPIFALDVLAELVAEDPSWELHLIGRDFADSSVPALATYAARFRRRALDPAIRDHIRWVGFTERLEVALDDCGFALSCSHVEGWPVGVTEAAASGSVPVIRDWPQVRDLGGARAIYAGVPEWVVGTPTEATARIRSFAEPAAWAAESARSAQLAEALCSVGSTAADYLDAILGPDR